MGICMPYRGIPAESCAMGKTRGALSKAFTLQMDFLLNDAENGRSQVFSHEVKVPMAEITRQGGGMHPGDCQGYPHLLGASDFNVMWPVNL